MTLRYSFLGSLLAVLLALAPTATAGHLYVAGLSGANEVPANGSTATGTAIAEIGADGTTVTITGSFSGLGSAYGASHIHLGAAGTNGGVIFPLNPTVAVDGFGGTWEAANNVFTFSAAQITALETDGLYVNVHTATFGGGEIRGQLGAPENAMIITGVVDGPLSGGVPKAVEFYVLEDIADLSAYGFGSANNGGGTDGVEFSFSGSASAGDFLYAASEVTGFTDFFGFAPTFDAGGAAGINGDDAIELFYAPGGAAGVVIDVFGDINTDGTGQPWEHLDGWAYRMDATGPDGSTFEIANWTFSGIDALDGETTNATAATPWPIGSYSVTMTPDPITLPVTFEEPIDYEFFDFEGTTTTLVTDPVDGSNTAAQTVRGAGSATFAGTVVAAANGLASPIPFTADATTMSMRVWSPRAGVPVRLKVERVGGGPTSETETLTTMAGMWETLVFDFANPAPGQSPVDPAETYDKLVTFFDFGRADSPMDETFYWDDIAFGGSTGGTDPVVSFETPEITWNEGGGFATVKVRIDYADGEMPDGLPVSVSIDLTGGTADASDVTSPTPMVLTFTGTMDGEIQEATLTAVGNDGDEPNETALFGLTVTAGAATVGEPSVFTFTIVDTDPLEFYTIADARTLGVGEYVSIRATVTRTEGAFTYIQDATGALTIRQTSGGFFDGVVDGSIHPGSFVRVTGELSEFRSLLQINDSDLNSFAVGGDQPIPAAQVVTLAELAANGEAYEAELVTVEVVTIGDGAGGGTFAPATTYPITDASDASGAVSLRVPNADDTTVDGTDVPPRANITAVVGQFSSDDPAVGYQLLVIEADDIEALPAVASENRPDGTVVSLTVANPIRGMATVRFSAGTASTASVALYDMLGRRVATLADGPVSGAQTVSLDASSLSAGVYVLRLQSEDIALTETVTVVR